MSLLRKKITLMATLHQSKTKKLKTRDAKHPRENIKKSRDSRSSSSVPFSSITVVLDCRLEGKKISTQVESWMMKRDNKNISDNLHKSTIKY